MLVPTHPVQGQIVNSGMPASISTRAGVTVTKGVNTGHAPFLFSFEFEKGTKAKVGERALLTHSTERRTCSSTLFNLLKGSGRIRLERPICARARAARLIFN